LGNDLYPIFTILTSHSLCGIIEAGVVMAWARIDIIRTNSSPSSLQFQTW
jgi:hypothetical protein